MLENLPQLGYVNALYSKYKKGPSVITSGKKNPIQFSMTSFKGNIKQIGTSRERQSRCLSHLETIKEQLKN